MTQRGRAAAADDLFICITDKWVCLKMDPLGGLNELLSTHLRIGLFGDGGARLQSVIASTS